LVGDECFDVLTLDLIDQCWHTRRRKEVAEQVHREQIALDGLR